MNVAVVVLHVEETIAPFDTILNGWITPST